MRNRKEYEANLDLIKEIIDLRIERTWSEIDKPKNKSKESEILIYQVYISGAQELRVIKVDVASVLLKYIIKLKSLKGDMNPDSCFLLEENVNKLKNLVEELADQSDSIRIFLNQKLKLSKENLRKCKGVFDSYKQVFSSLSETLSQTINEIDTVIGNDDDSVLEVPITLPKPSSTISDLAFEEDNKRLCELYRQLAAKETITPFLDNNETDDDELVLDKRFQAFLEEVNSLDQEETGNDVYNIDITELQFLQKIAVGTTGALYRGKWRHNDVAIKIFEPLDNLAKRHFKEEMRKLLQMRSTYIARVYGYACYSAIQFLVIEYFPKGSLYDYIDNTKLNLKQKCALARNILYGVDNIHLEDMYHGGLNSFNILIDENGHAKVSDFGYRQTMMSSQMSTSLREQKPLLNKEWIAPEVSKNQISKWSDIYSVGMILWEIFSGQHPTEEMRNAIKEYKDLSKYRIEKYPALWKCIARCWHKTPTDRHTIKELIKYFNDQKDFVTLFDCDYSLSLMNVLSEKPSTKSIELCKSDRTIRARVTNQEGISKEIDLLAIPGVSHFNPFDFPWLEARNQENIEKTVEVVCFIDWLLLSSYLSTAPVTVGSVKISPLQRYFLGREHLEKKEYNDALACFLQADKDGIINAKIALVEMYARGFGMPKPNIQQAKLLYDQLKSNPLVTQRRQGLADLVRVLQFIPDPAPRILPRIAGTKPAERSFVRRQLRPETQQESSPIQMIALDFDDTLLHMPRANMPVLKINNNSTTEGPLKIPELIEPCLVYAALRKIPIFIVTSRTKAMDTSTYNGGASVMDYRNYLRRKYGFEIIKDQILDENFRDACTDEANKIDNFKKNHPKEALYAQGLTASAYFDYWCAGKNYALLKTMESMGLNRDTHLSKVLFMDDASGNIKHAKNTGITCIEVIAPDKVTMFPAGQKIDESNFLFAKEFAQLVGLHDLAFNPVMFQAEKDHRIQQVAKNYKATLSAYQRGGTISPKFISIETNRLNDLKRIVTFTGNITYISDFYAPFPANSQGSLCFIFTSNNSHSNNLLQSSSGGSGLAAVAKMLSQNKVPVTGLPTVNKYTTNKLLGVINKFVEISVTFDMARQAITMIWYLVGLGLELVLPVRDRNADGKIINDNEIRELIDSGLITNATEPKLLGGVKESLLPGERNFVQNEKNISISLLEYYCNHLAKTHNFIQEWNRRDTNERLTLLDTIADVQFRQAFNYGRENQNSETRLQVSPVSLEATLRENAKAHETVISFNEQLTSFNNTTTRTFFLPQPKRDTLKEIVNGIGFELKRTIRDGNCFFTAIAIWLKQHKGLNLQSADIRREAVNYMGMHSTTFQVATDQNFTKETQGQYLQRMIKDKEWATPMIIQATALCYKLRFTIYDFHQNGDIIFTDINHEAGEDKPLFILGRTGGDSQHQQYDVLLPLMNPYISSSSYNTANFKG